MKLIWILFAAAALTLTGCDRTDDKSSARGGSSMETPKGAATGQASEGSTDDRKAPERPSSK